LESDDGTFQEVPIKVTEFREYQVSSYVLKRRESDGAVALLAFTPSETKKETD
jgi:hypothetical protein